MTPTIDQSLYAYMNVVESILETIEMSIPETQYNETGIEDVIKGLLMDISIAKFAMRKVLFK